MKRKIKLNELGQIAKDLINQLEKNKSGNSVVIALSGELGSGKTTLTQQIAKTLGINDVIISPTFVIMKRYEIDPFLRLPLSKGEVGRGFKNLIHIDAYRLKNSDELIKIGWQDMYSNKDNLIIIEWPEMVEGLIPENSIKVQLSHVDGDTREILL